MKAFRHTAAGPIAVQIVASLRAGQTSRMVARRQHLPVDFIELVRDQAVASGELTVLDLNANRCGISGCAPDPDSFVCAGCPMMAASKRRKSTKKHGIRNILNASAPSRHMHGSR